MRWEGQGKETDVQVGATTSFNIVALANISAETHVNEAWAASIQQGPISQAFNITLRDAMRSDTVSERMGLHKQDHSAHHVTASRVNSTLCIKVPETRAILAIGETRTAPREETRATGAKTFENPKGPIALTRRLERLVKGITIPAHPRATSGHHRRALGLLSISVLRWLRLPLMVDSMTR